MAELFNVDRSVISKHLSSIFESLELDQDVVCAKFAQTTEHGAMEDKEQTKDVKFYNLDAIISVGYRVIERYIAQYEDELKHNGYFLSRGKSLKEFKLQFAHVINEASKTTPFLWMKSYFLSKSTQMLIA